MDKQYSPLTHEELRLSRRYAVEDERARIAGHLTRLAEMEQEGGRRRAYLEALDDVASSIGLKRTEKVTYSA